MNKVKCEFEEGDRVDHQLFGFGTVNGAPQEMNGPDAGATGGVRSAGWGVPVRWDDPDTKPCVCMHQALRKVSSPDSRPFTYWERQWQPLLQAWLVARQQVETAASTFRPMPDLGNLARLQDVERKAFEAMQGFWEQERAGDHP